MYYRLTNDPVTLNVFLKRKSHRFTTLVTGVPLPETTVVPFEFVMEVNLDPEGRVEAPRMSPFFASPCVMHRRFLEVVRAAGADNVQTFPAVLTDGRTGQRHTDYFAANVVGLVPCANLAQSQTSPLADVYYFQELVLDPAKTEGRLLFRLAESQIEIVVHEKVAAALRAEHFDDVVLEPLRSSASGS